MKFYKGIIERNETLLIIVKIVIYYIMKCLKISFQFNSHRLVAKHDSSMKKKTLVDRMAITDHMTFNFEKFLTSQNNRYVTMEIKCNLLIPFIY